MRIAIIGGAGYLGKNLTLGLSEVSGTTVDCIDICETPELYQDRVQSGSICYHQLSFLSDQANSELFSKCDAVVHLGRTISPGPGNKDYQRDVKENVLGSARLLEEAIKAGVKDFIFISSGGTVYGELDEAHGETKLSEDHFLNPISYYGLSTMMIEKYLGLIAKGTETKFTVLRLSNPYGPHQQLNRRQGLINTVIMKAISKEVIEIWGDGEAIRDYIFVDDVVSAIQRVIEYKGNLPVFNIGSGVGKSINQVIDDIVASTGITINKKYVASRNSDVKANILDINLAKQALNWAPEVPWNDAIQKTYEHYFTELSK